MKRLSKVLVASLALFLIPNSAAAQGVDVGVVGLGLISVQSTDHTYESPYLDNHAGGLAPGFGGGISLIGSGGLTAAAEITTARFTRQQSGRVIPGNCQPIPLSFECSTTTRLHDSMLSAMIGYSTMQRRVRTTWLGGMSLLLDSATTNGVSIQESGSTDGRRGFTGGMDVLITTSRRIAVVAGTRYTFISRTDEEVRIGAGSHVLRILGGIRIRLN